MKINVETKEDKENNSKSGAKEERELTNNRQRRMRKK